VFSSARPAYGIHLQRAASALPLFAILTSVSCGPTVTNAPPKKEVQTIMAQTGSPAPERVAGEYIVSVAPGGDATTVRNVYAAYGVRDVADLGDGNFLIKLTRDPGPDEIKQKGVDSGKVKTAQPNFIYRTQ